MGKNWIEDIDEGSNEFDRKLKEDAKKYDEEVGKWWRLNADKEDDEDEISEDE